MQKLTSAIAVLSICLCLCTSCLNFWTV